MKNTILIITTESLKGAFNRFISDKSSKGFNVICVTVESIYIPEPGVDVLPLELAGKIKEYIDSFSCEEPYYVILGGGYKEVPALDAKRYSFSYIDSSNVSHTGEAFAPSDYKYTLNSSGKMKFAVGRFPVGTENEMFELCERSISYFPKKFDQNLIVADYNTSNFTKIIAGMLKGNVICIDNEKPVDFLKLGQEILQRSFILYTGHGNPLYWNYGVLGMTDDGNRLFTESEIPSMPHSPHVCCWACATACYSVRKDCIGVSWIKKGAMTYWGASYQTRRSKNRAMAIEMLNIILKNPNKTVGEVYLQVLEASQDCECEKICYVLFGDPTLNFFSIP